VVVVNYALKSNHNSSMIFWDFKFIASLTSSFVATDSLNHACSLIYYIVNLSFGSKASILSKRSLKLLENYCPAVLDEALQNNLFF